MYSSILAIIRSKSVAKVQIYDNIYKLETQKQQLRSENYVLCSLYEVSESKYGVNAE